MEVKKLAEDAIEQLLLIEESHFVDLKAAAIAPSKLSRTLSAFANTSGGEIYLGIEEEDTLEGKVRKWNGFIDQEAANAFFQVIEANATLSTVCRAEFLASTSCAGFVLHFTIFKSREIVFATDGRAYVRRSAQSLPVSDEQALERLRYDKGVKSFEDELLDVALDEVTNSTIIIEFMLDVIPTGEPEDWLKKQRVILNERPTVAGVLLFSDLPQATLAKRSAIKILRYQTKSDAERDFLVFDPITVEGPLYNLIYDAVDKVKEIIEGIEKLGANGMERIQYPPEALHEILTNAVLHRNYNVASDVQVRIFDNRVEIESPGRLPGHVTTNNIISTQFARNPKLVRLVNKFQNPPNKDVGEGLNTAFEAMNKLRLKKPIIIETDNSVVVTLRHESLGSPEQLVMEYLNQNDQITNAIGRELTGITSENTMKSVFYRLRDTKQIEQVKEIGKKPAWRRIPT
ncbi:ATP-dependent DNA helicase RecG [Rhodanobacter glycinis]|uniref:ATP-dependent DNA helicase RecG n=1 Tax=Rhodanobacter glycinis TaxID=582702 RepID=A0A502C6J7_9GAMM|nr:ATP-dependent DNA helicase RecG [Rhodanobacter glycinis]